MSETEVVENDQALLLVSGSRGEKGRDKEYVKKLANAVLQVLHKHDVVRMRCVGAAALNNATKAFIIARGECLKKGERLVSEDSFTTVMFESGEKTGILKEITALSNDIEKPVVVEGNA
tara:strand:- start:2967 stop:3323 length:357 start_codon:yes stop_codon:yes gene_type:complete